MKSSAYITADARDKFIDAATAGLLDQAGYAPRSDKSRQYCGYSLRELCIEALNVTGRSIRLSNVDGGMIELVGRALTESDFPVLMSNVANKILFDEYEKANETWQDWCSVGSVKDFKPTTIAKASEMPGLEPIINDTGYEYGRMSDAGETVQLGTFGKIYAFTRHSIVNDDLQALVDSMKGMAETASRKVGDLAYAVLTSNAALSDGVNLFHPSHGNVGTPGVVSELAIGEGIKLMGLQKDLLEERRLNIRPQYFIAPVALEGSAEIFFLSNQFSVDDKGSTRTNPYGGSRFTRVYDARLDDSSSTTWYLAGPKGKTVRLFFLKGHEKPTVETQDGWLADGIEFKVRLDAAAKAVDYRALVKNAGA